MGYFIYCKRCKIPVKAFETGEYMICGHKNKHADGNIFSSNTDNPEELEEWNKLYLDNQVSYELAYEGKKMIKRNKKEEKLQQIIDILDNIKSYVSKLEDTIKNKM